MPEISILILRNEARTTARIDRVPDACPVCGHGGKPEFLAAARVDEETLSFPAVFICPFERCRAPYLAYYRIGNEFTSSTFQLVKTGTPFTFTAPRGFPASVNALSPSFSKIYNQAASAEDGGLDEICGPGYRKALEFLVKDFVLNHELKNAMPEERQKVLTTLLGPCIEKYISDPRIKAAAKRATWLGNDETHYTRKWDEKDIEDLKTLIDMTLNWINLVVLSERYDAEMPEKKDAK